MIDVDVMQDASEIVHYDEVGIPLYIRKGDLSFYPDMKALCHWHEDLELIYIASGEMNYDINGKKIFLQQGDSLVVNTCQLHYGYSNQYRDCKFICILFHPSLLAGNKKLYQKYIQPVLEDMGTEYLHYESASQSGEKMAGWIQKIYGLKYAENICDYELEALGYLSLICSEVYRHCHSDNVEQESAPDSDVMLQKKMVSYIYQHYTETLTLDDIADAGNVSRSKCCIIFKRYLKQSPIDFLNAYRLSVSCNLLKNTDLKITEIATSCGFNHLSYFSKLFMRKYGCTPSEYRGVEE